MGYRLLCSRSQPDVKPTNHASACMRSFLFATRVDDVYELGHELGKGAFSVVKHGRHRQTGENVRNSMKAAPEKLEFLVFKVVGAEYSNADSEPPAACF